MVNFFFIKYIFYGLRVFVRQQVLILSYQIILKYFLQMVVMCNILPSGNNIFYDIQYIFGYFPQISLNLVSEY